MLNAMRRIAAAWRKPLMKVILEATRNQLRRREIHRGELRAAESDCCYPMGRCSERPAGAADGATGWSSSRRERNEFIRETSAAPNRHWIDSLAEMVDRDGKLLVPGAMQTDRAPARSRSGARWPITRISQSWREPATGATMRSSTSASMAGCPAQRVPASRPDIPARARRRSSSGSGLPCRRVRSVARSAEGLTPSVIRRRSRPRTSRSATSRQRPVTHGSTTRSTRIKAAVRKPSEGFVVPSPPAPRLTVFLRGAGLPSIVTGCLR